MRLERINQETQGIIPFPIILDQDPRIPIHGYFLVFQEAIVGYLLRIEMIHPAEIRLIDKGWTRTKKYWRIAIPNPETRNYDTMNYYYFEHAKKELIKKIQEKYEVETRYI